MQNRPSVGRDGGVRFRALLPSRESEKNYIQDDISKRDEIHCAESNSESRSVSKKKLNLAVLLLSHTDSISSVER